jgi:thymidylate synthase (FAD)
VAIDAMQTTAPDQWRTQATTNRQGSDGVLPLDQGTKLTQAEQTLQTQMRGVYEERLAAGVAREQARKDLPLSTYTEAYWKVDLHNLLHFLRLRMDAHAQLEIREYARTIGEQIVKPLFPIAWEAFVDYRLEGALLSRLEREVMQRLLARGAAQRTPPPYTEADFLAVQDESWRSLNRCRERDECRDKLVDFGLLALSTAPPQD